VGGDPTIPGTTVEQFHRRMCDRAEHWPGGMSATGTHDTKRGEDMRARLNVLSEIPEVWAAAVRRWQAQNAAARAELDGAPAPDSNEEYLIYQTLLGTWPLESLDALAREAYVERIVQYLDKALREAKLHTSWLNPYVEYDQAVAGFIRTILADAASPFVRDMQEFSRSIADAGYVNALAQTLVKIAAPGVPDFYQGVEFWDFNLVDPDNRRPVDFAARREALDGLQSRARKGVGRAVRELLARWPDPRIKMLLIWRGLEFRRHHPEVFGGGYLPLATEGAHGGQLLAFARGDLNGAAVCIVPRMTYESWRTRKGARKVSFGGRATPWPLASWWRETTIILPPECPSRWRHLITDDEITCASQPDGSWRLDAADVFRSFPVALLTSA
jgi:(1->4)-alpha-D-glucan 1-alpha-D-glucosylmutase